MIFEFPVPKKAAQDTSTMVNSPCHAHLKRSKEKELTNNAKFQVVGMLLEMCVEGQLPYGKISAVAKKFQIGQETVSSLWSNDKLSSAAEIVAELKVCKK